MRQQQKSFKLSSRLPQNHSFSEKFKLAGTSGRHFVQASAQNMVYTEFKRGCFGQRPVRSSNITPPQLVVSFSASPEILLRTYSRIRSSC